MANYSSQRTDRDVVQTIQRLIRERNGCGASAREVAEEVGCSLSTAQRSIWRLERSGKLVILSTKGKPNKYEVVSERLSSPA